MVIGLLTIAAIPSTIGVCEALSAQKKQNAADKEKAKFTATAALSLAGEPPADAPVVLIGGRLFLDHPDARVAYGRAHPFSGYYFNYPGDTPCLGLVSTIAVDPPMLNWIYADKDTGRLLHAGRKDTLGHRVGPWGWSDDETWLTYEGDATRFVAAQEEIAIGDEITPVWGIYLQDPDADEDVADGRGVPILIRRSFGMESKYVRDSQREKHGLEKR
ncbi:uncharacterized protein SPSK_06623 [Sporothrix schenckii 1099-18]|uniref:Uncharacterized protein n=2 Tax=Sporothrix schenckii TaxID=29908 RepID=U7PI11_SPOS1|nr:uncharacterized protein SPSK_06623 [Sporothrix schenckii 1099-18]ERS95233.1 hypothetical protein HMPREF1624_08445 [Sporothrix schenckii ATCC 58251]KJR90035.1 hypothetical protein SPSK_06623 [Sporothrix schenckii 1099-18]